MTRVFSRFSGAVLAALIFGVVSPADAGIAKIKGLHDDHERPAPLIKAPVMTLKERGNIFVIIGGDYGFDLFDEGGSQVASFADSDSAIGFELQPGRYKVIPHIEGDVHHHQFIEVLIKTD